MPTEDSISSNSAPVKTAVFVITKLSLSVISLDFSDNNIEFFAVATEYFFEHPQARCSVSPANVFFHNHSQFEDQISQHSG